ncbi:MAG TPA: ABC transporter permease [Halanaerobiales bacterium]|nr:ABC transporter permease [Halanaerobiales bacterium]HMA60198.1 ABC transporter permease [Halanaerobiales bacterium]
MNLPIINKSMSRNAKVFISLLLVVVVLFAISGIFNPRSLSPNHILEVVRQSAPLGITAMGQSAVILTGGIDLSVGEIITMTNIISADMMKGRNLRTVPVVLLLLLIGALIGGMNGFMIATTNIPPMVMTFAMSSMVKGGYLLYSGGAPRGRVSPILRYIGTERFLGIPVTIIVYALLIVAVLYYFQKTKWGRSAYFIGNNPVAAEYAGIPKTYRLIMIYAFSAMMAVIAGLILSGYIGIGNFDVGGDSYMLNSIASSVVGGNTFNGIGNVGGAAIGALIITVIESVMTSLGVAETGKLVMRGIIIITMVTLYMGSIDLGKVKKLFSGEGGSLEDARGN